MPGLSLWLLPPSPTSNIDNMETRLQTFITTSAPKILNETLPHFTPHITLTSYIPPELIEPSPQEWLDKLPLPSEKPVVNFKQVSTGTAYFKKLYIRMHKTPSLVKFASACRRICVEEAASPWRNDGGNVDRGHESMPTHDGVGMDERMKHWAGWEFDPHLSLVYSDTAVGEQERAATEEELERLGITMFPGEDYGNQESIGWTGGRVVLVSTHLDLKDWDVVAERVL